MAPLWGQFICVNMDFIVSSGQCHSCVCLKSEYHHIGDKGQNMPSAHSNLIRPSFRHGHCWTRRARGLVVLAGWLGR